MQNKLIYVTDTNWKIEVERGGEIPLKSFVGDNYFKTEWYFKATNTSCAFTCSGSLYTEYDNMPDKWDVIKGLQEKFNNITVELAKYLCKE